MTVTTVAPAAAGIEIGSYFTRSWGYDQTNVDFYRVVGLTPKGVRVQHWSSHTVHDNPPTTHVVPGAGPRVNSVWPKADRDELLACTYCWDQGGFAYRMCPDHGPRPTDAPVEVKRLSSYDGGDSVYVAVGPYHDHAYRWDGTPRYETASGWGH